MKIGKMILKGCIPVLAVAVVVTFVVVNAKSSSQDLDGVIIGEYCFSFDSFTDTWHWRVDDIGNGFYQIAGFDHVYPGSAFDGSGHREGKYFYAMCHLSNPSYNVRLIYTIILDLTTWTGTSDLTIRNTNGTLLTYYDDLPFSMVNCPASDADLKEGLSTIESALR